MFGVFSICLDFFFDYSKKIAFLVWSKILIGYIGSFKGFDVILIDGIRVLKRLNGECISETQSRTRDN